MCNTRIVSLTYPSILPPNIEVHPSIDSLFEQLEAGGWIPRKCIDGRAVAFWPDGHRGNQLRIDVTYPVNEHKLDFYREHTQLDLVGYKESDENEEG